MPIDHGVGDRFGQLVELDAAHAILEPRERRLRGQWVARDGGSARQHLVDRILGQHASVVAVRVAECDREHPLPEELCDLVPDLARSAAIPQTRGQLLAQPQLLVYALQQQSSTVRAAVGLIEGRQNGLRTQVGKKNGLCCRIRHAEGPWIAWKRSRQPVSSNSVAFLR